jgi:hypothetical protein
VAVAVAVHTITSTLRVAQAAAVLVHQTQLMAHQAAQIQVVAQVVITKQEPTQAVQDLSLFVMPTLMTQQFQPQVHQQLPTQAVTEFTNGQEAGA